MDIVANESKLKNDPIALLLIELIKDLDVKDAILYYNFPFYRGESTEELVQAHVLFISPTFGVIFFRCINSYRDFTDLEKRKLDDLDGHIFSKINKYDEFRLQRRELKIKVTPLVFVNSDKPSPSDEFVNVRNLHLCIESNKKTILTENEFELLVSIIEGTVRLRKKKDREIDSTGNLTKGKILSIIQNKHAVFDLEQKKAALNTINSPQRIRGLAGSGKTIILTMKAALYHLEEPEAEILYTYFTKALFGQIKYLIEKYYRDFSENREPNWNKIHILHGWGGSGLGGVYSNTCAENGIQAIKLLEARAMQPKDPFDYVCEKIEPFDLKLKYDLTLIDEGQDFPTHFYRLCRKITKENRIVWAYDDFQNIFDVTIQDERETFGKDKDGNYYVDFSKNENNLQDIPLERCYRNPRISLITAFSLGLGIYNDKVLQRLENNKHWEDLGFEVEKGDSNDGAKMLISRPEINSPIELNEFFSDDAIQIQTFNNIEEECNFVSSQIIMDIKEQKLLPDDICVISLDSKAVSAYFNRIEETLVKNGIQVFNLLNASSNNIYFNLKNNVTLSTLNKAKGNETGMVYIVGADSVFNNKDYIIDRNKLFTAITRSKGWVYITGYPQAQICANEMLKLKENNYKLSFIQPSKAQTKTILRGMTKRESFISDVSKKIESFSKVSGLTPKEIIELLSKEGKPRK
jgi:superfamily I DNA and RNA helicase